MLLYPCLLFFCRLLKMFQCNSVSRLLTLRAVSSSVVMLICVLQHSPCLCVSDHAVLIEGRFVVSFDGKVFEVAGRCSVVLAQDFTQDSFTVLLRQEPGGRRSLYLEMNQTVITILPGPRVQYTAQRPTRALSRPLTFREQSCNITFIFIPTGTEAKCTVQIRLNDCYMCARIIQTD